MVGEGKEGEDIVQRANVGIRMERLLDYESEGNMLGVKIEGGKRIKRAILKVILLLKVLKVKFSSIIIVL